MQTTTTKQPHSQSLLNYVKLVLTIVVWLLMFSPTSAHASSLIVSPPRLDISAKAGDILQQVVKITNQSNAPVSLSAKVSDFLVADDNGTPIQITTAASGRYLASPWFSLDKPELTLAAGQTTQVIAVIEIPKDALPGGHYAGVFFIPLTKSKLDTTGAIVTPQIGSLFDITIAGDIKYDALIKDFSVKDYLSEFGPINFSATVINQSDTHIHPTSKITIHDMIGRQLAQIPLDGVNIFPFAGRTLTGKWNQIWGVGRYTATLSLAYGPGLVTSRDLTFWIMPYRLLAAILVVLLVILAVFILVRRHLKHQEDHRDEEIDDLKRKIIEMENRH